MDRRRTKPILALGALLLLGALLAPPAQASQAITTYTLDTSTTESGGHPDITSFFRLDKPGEPEVAKNVTLNLPEGLFGNPRAIPICSSVEFALSQCAAGSQVGLITVRGNYLGNPNFLFGTAPVYDVDPQGDSETARLAFVVPTVDIPIAIPISVRSGTDYGLRMTVAGITQQIPLASVNLEIWGLPASTTHDPERFHKGTPGNPSGCAGLTDASCVAAPFPTAGVTVAPFTINPTVCTGQPLKATLEVQTYQDPDHPSSIEEDFPAVTGCEKQTFNPVFNVGLTTNETDSPSGLNLQFIAEQPLGLANSPSELRSASATLPVGLSINPDAADGQSACLDSEANFNNDKPGECPDNAKIGTVEIHSEALEGPLTGSLYFGEPKPGNQYRVFMIADGFGLHVKLFASVKPDPETGQLTISMVDLPQVPFNEFDVHLFASDRGLVATPTHCRVYATDSEFVPWNHLLAPQHSAPNFSINSGPGGRNCPALNRPFNPRLVAGTANPIAGDYSSFTLRLDRDDGDQFLGDLNFRMPPGFTGNLQGISYCPEASIVAAAQRLGREEQISPSCPASSQIGTSNVSAGPGSHPFHAVGKMYLSGPFKGAPLSLAAVTPALAGPYDYGVVVVRVALYVDPLTAQVTAVSDTVPSIIGGVPIRMRSIQVNIDREKFTINPTRCAPFTVDSQGIGDQGTVADFSSYFQAVNCRSLAFKPKMSIRLAGGRKDAKRAKNPELQFDMRTRPGDANIKSLAVTLSTAFAIDQRHLGNICSEKELAEKECAGRTPIGKATTTTPLLDQPLSGPVYAVSGGGGLPRLAFILKGQVNLVPRAETKTVFKGGAGQLQTVVPVVPDAPIGHFSLTVFGGKTGYLINTRSLCAKTPVTKVDYTAQSGKTHTENVKLKAACGKKSKKSRHKRGARR